MTYFDNHLKIPFATIGAAILLLSSLQADVEQEEAIDTQELATYTVTGTYLPADIKAAPVPLTRIDADDLTRWGQHSPIQALRKQPFTYGNTNTENESNGSTGSASANLRGLGNLSTLTLINGRRAGGNSAFGNQHGGFADLNLIPSAAIKEIQVATDGTSVTYGSDAVAGTVNVLLHDTFTGNRVDGSYSNTTDGDASEKAFSFLTGQDLGESTHLVLMGSWYQRNSIEARDRHRSRDTDFRPKGGSDQGSLTFPGRINVSPTGNGDTGQRIRIDMNDPSLGYRPWLPDSPTEPVGRYNFNEYAPAIPKQERSSVMADIIHELSDSLELFGEFLYTETSFDNGLAPAPWTAANSPFEHANLFSAIVGTPGFPSPHFPASILQNDLKQVSYRSYELGNLEVEQDKDAVRGLLGLRGELGAWNWESAIMLIETDLKASWSGIADARSLEDNIIDGSFNPFAGAYATGGTVQPDNSIVYYDNAVALQSAQTKADVDSKESYEHFDFKANAPIFEIPAGEVYALLGTEYREEEIDVDVDELFQGGNSLGGPANMSPFDARREVASAFAESTVPLLSSRNTDSDQTLNLNLAARYETYRDKGATTNTYDAFVYKSGLVFQPNQHLRLRAGYGTSFRAPTLTESFGAPQVAYYIYNDAQTPAGTRVPTLINGNSDLDPETSTNLNLGITLESAPDRGWRLSVDYYRIETEDAIVNSGQAVVDDGAAYRYPDGRLFVVPADWFNAAEVLTDGIDYELTYRQPTSTGFWQATLGVNQVLTYEIQATDNGPTVSYLGRMVDPRLSNENIAGPGSIPRYKGYAELTWQREGLTLAGMVNYVHSLDDNESFTTDGQSRRVDSWTTLDVFGSYNWGQQAGDWLNGTTLTLGIENATDEAPPFAAGAFADGYDSSLYSLAGRRIRISVSREF